MILYNGTPSPGGSSSFYAGVGISGGNSMKIGFIAVRLAVAGFMISYLFALNPGLLFINSTIGHTLLLIVTV